MGRIVNVVFWGLFLSALFCLTAHAATYTAASCAESAVQSAVNQTSNGDTVLIPVSSCPTGVTWGSNSSSDVALSITKGITLNGQGVTITDNTYKGNPSTCQGTVPLISVSESSNVFVRVTDMSIIGVLNPLPPNCGESSAHIAVTGSTQQFRVDHVSFNTLAVSGVSTSGGVNGVVDHNAFYEPTSENPPFPIAIHHDSWNGVGGYGDNSWAQPDTFGQAGAVYIENNSFSFTSNYFPTGCFDSEVGGRLVFRFNTGCPFVGAHGLDSSGRLRSVRQWEIYDNSFLAQPNPNANMYTGIFLRGGTGFVFSNTFTDTGTSTPYETLAQLNSYRDTSGYAPWGYGGTASVAGAAEECDGRGGFDTNAGAVYATFTAASNSGLDNTIASGSPGWSTNQWADSFTANSVTYSLVDTTAGWGSTIQSNTTNTIVTSSAAQPGNGPAHTATNGDAMEVIAGSPCLDQIGRGAGALIQDSGSWSGIPVLQSTGKPGPDNQASDPAYEWLNSLDGTTQPAFTTGGVGYFHIQKNRDFYDWTSSFNGSSGVGAGILASRPATCTTGVAYWATDQGSWNQSGSGGQGELFICTAANTWTLYYTPYTYPHPLVSQTSTASQPSPPTNLTATPTVQ